MASIPEWVRGQAFSKGDLRTYTQGSRLDVFVALVNSSDSPINSVFPPSGLPQSSDIWLELDNYNGSYVSGIAYPKGHIVDHPDNDGTILWYIAPSNLPTQNAEPGSPNSPWLLFGGRRTPAIPAIDLSAVRWRAPLTIVDPPQAINSGVKVTEDALSDQVLIRIQPPSDAIHAHSVIDEESVIPLGTLQSLDPLEVGTDLFNTRDAPDGSYIDLSQSPFEKRTRLARDAKGYLLIQVPRDRNNYPAGMAARFTFATNTAWPRLFFAATHGDIQFNVSEHGVMQGQLSQSVTGRLAPTPTPDTRGNYVRQSEDGETYELTEQAPAGTTDSVYATADDYRARNTASSGLDEDLINEQLEAASRTIDQELRVMPGYFAPHSATYILPSQSGRKLWLRDEAGFAYALRSVAENGIRPDYDLEGTYASYQWDFNDTWLWGNPRNGVETGFPFHALELRNISSAPFLTWPVEGGSVQIEGEWGWAAVPAAIRELTVRVARDMRDRQRAGGGMRVDVMDDVVSFRDDTWRLWLTIKMSYGRKQAMVW